LAEELKGPAIFEIRQYIQNKNWVEFYTVNDRVIKGQILWFDGDSYHLKLENQQEITLLKHAVVYYNMV